MQALHNNTTRQLPPRTAKVKTLSPKWVFEDKDRNIETGGSLLRHDLCATDMNQNIELISMKPMLQS